MAETKLKKQIHVHFMGIGGSGIGGVAILAKKYGFLVSGCDLEKQTSYSSVLEKFKIKYFVGHNVAHLKNVDILAVSPAVLISQSNHPEILEAKKQKILMTWQEFQGKYLQKGKMVIAVAGTHGKSTVTAMLGLLLESVGLDPTVEVGAIVPKWGTSFRFGRSKYFICEADEFNNNFLNYSPGIIILNNLEMDHPEFFHDFDDFLGAFIIFVKMIKNPKILIVNKKDQGVKKLLKEMRQWLIEERVKVVDFYRGEMFGLKVPGLHNEINARAVIACGKELKIKFDQIKKFLKNFEGISRRFELVGQERGIKIFDDYAVHPTAIKATLKVAKQKYPKEKIWAIFEPHQFSRLKIFLNKFAQSLSLAEKVIVTQIYKGREKEDKTIKPQDLVKKIGKKAEYISDFEKIAEKVAQQAFFGDIVIVFGAGKSYLLSKMIFEQLKKSK